MSIDSNEIIKTAKLAKLSIEDSNKDEITHRIAAILDLVGQMQNIDTDNVEPMANSHDAYQILRDDEVFIPENPIRERDQIQSCAPSVDEGLYLVPKVID